MRILIAVLLSLVCLRAEARNVYLNGVKLDDAVILKNQSFSACDVKFDDAGDVWITAKGVKVALAPASSTTGAPAPTAPAPAAAPAAVPALKKTWILASESNRGAAQYTVEIWLNNARVRTIRSGDNATAADITQWVRAGDNKLHVVAVKQLGDHRVSTSAADVLEIVVGQGEGPGSIVPVVTYKRSAAETTGFSDDFSFAPR